ncbi:MAG: hypothetical protein Q9Q13_02565 [Acidobacteriota bacterium]|nr:hypothetical protein [Acidobacteriota bacterium]
MAVLVDTGLLREDEKPSRWQLLRDRCHLPVEAVDARARFLGTPGGGSPDPGGKRRRIGRTFIDVLRRSGEPHRRPLPGPGRDPPRDRIESASTGGPSSLLRSSTHHNVGGLPERT